MRRSHDPASLARDVQALASQTKGAAADVRAAVRDLTLHALRSRLLTAEHLASVTKTVGQGIGNVMEEPAADARSAAGHAMQGLGDAVAKGLLALELAAREFADAGGRLNADESQQIIDEIARLEQTLGKDWQHEHVMLAPAKKQRLADLAAHVQRAVSGARQAEPAMRNTLHELQATVHDGKEAAVGAARILGLMASGALLGVSEVLRETATPGEK